jgi:hypothetical protein
MSQPDFDVRSAPMAEKMEPKELILSILRAAEERGASVYDLTQATELEPQGVLDACRELQASGEVIHAEIHTAHHLELFFVLEQYAGLLR